MWNQQVRLKARMRGRNKDGGRSNGTCCLLYTRNVREPLKHGKLDGLQHALVIVNSFLSATSIQLTAFHQAQTLRRWKAATGAYQMYHSVSRWQKISQTLITLTWNNQDLWSLYKIVQPESKTFKYAHIVRHYLQGMSYNHLFSNGKATFSD